MNTSLRAALPTTLGLYLKATPGFLSWRESRIREARDYMKEIRWLEEFLLQVPSFMDLLRVCVRTRLFWSRIHSAGLGRGVPPEIESEAREFLRVVDRLNEKKNDIFERCTGKNRERANRYFDSMAYRKELVALALLNDPAALYGKLAEGAGEGAGPEGAVEEGETPGRSTAQVLVGGAYWVLSSKLLSWSIELQGEAGPDALSFKDHGDLITGTLQIFRLLIEAAKIADGKEETVARDEALILEAEEFRREISVNVRKELARRWTRIQIERPFRLSDLESEEFELDHPLDEESRRFVVDDLIPEVKRYADEASRRWKRVNVGKVQWQAWLSLSYLPIGEDAPEEIPVPVRSLRELADSLKTCGNPQVIEHLIERLGSEKAVNQTGEKPEALINLLISRLLFLHFESGFQKASERIARPSGKSRGFFELELAGMIGQEAMYFRGARGRGADFAGLARKVSAVPAEQYGGQINKNCILGGLVATFAVLTHPDRLEIKEFLRLYRTCLEASGTASERGYFLRALVNSGAKVLMAQDRTHPFLRLIAGWCEKEGVEAPEVRELLDLEKLLAEG